MFRYIAKWIHKISENAIATECKALLPSKGTNVLVSGEGIGKNGVLS
jgi:hypothetical protein